MLTVRVALDPEAASLARQLILALTELNARLATVLPLLATDIVIPTSAPRPQPRS